MTIEDGGTMEIQARLPLKTSPPDKASSMVIIAPAGDVVLHVKNEKIGIDEQYRCSRGILRAMSGYFDVLLHPTKFSEGIAIDSKIKDIKSRYKDFALTPTAELPRIIIRDIGHFPKTSIGESLVLTLFLKILHNPCQDWPMSHRRSVTLLALLAVVADRFVSVNEIGGYISKSLNTTKLFDERKSEDAQQKELNNRQKLYAGTIFGFSDWVRQYSTNLIVEGSVNWLMDTCLERDKELHRETDRPIWWILPNGMEEELCCRREYVLETIGSLQSHFIGLYTSKQLQCKLGYDTSPQCDSFQLGEMIRFFTRKGTINIQNAFVATEEPRTHIGDVHSILDRLRECPSYQLDKNHFHCGLRTRLLPLLNALWPDGQAGVCLRCWNHHRAQESWLEYPTRGQWVLPKATSRRWEHCKQHVNVKAMYTAEKRNWTPFP